MEYSEITLAFRAHLRAAALIDRGLTALVVGLAGLNLVVLLVVMALRARFPFELEWIEGGTVTTLQHILSGRFLYGRPSLEFVPLLYNPVYYYLSAGLSAMVGVGFLAPRLISILATVGSWALIFALVRRETGRAWAGVATAGLYAATFKMTGTWSDLARVDALLVFFLLLAAYWARRAPGAKGALGCAALLALAYFTKQSALTFFVAFGGYYLLESRRAWPVFFASVLVFVLVPIGLLNLASDGWYTFYTWGIARNTVLDATSIRYFWYGDLWGNMPFAFVGGLIVLTRLGNPFRRSDDGTRSRFYLALTAGAFASSWWGRALAGGLANTLMPVAACLAILFGLLLGLPRPARFQWAWRPVVLLLAVAQFWVLAYDPRTMIPSPRAEHAGQELLALIRAYPGEVFIPAHSYYTAMVGKPTYAQWAAVVDVSGLWDTDLDTRLGGPPDPRRRIILDEIEQAVMAQRFDAIILDDNDDWLTFYWNKVLAPYYHLERRVFVERDEFRTIVDPRWRPQLVYVPTRP